MLLQSEKYFFSDLHNYFLSQGLLLIGGDFNCIDNVLDKLNCSTVPSADKTSLVTLMSDFSLADVWRKQNPRTVSFIWPNSDLTQASRIDRFFKPNLFLIRSLLVRYYRAFCLIV